ncbi:hypothetical protein MRX96_032915 [Rhipicephalus microplus]
MEKGSADKPESPIPGTYSPTSPPRQQRAGLAAPRCDPVGQTSPIVKEVASRDGVESTNLLTNDAAITGGAVLGMNVENFPIYLSVVEIKRNRLLMQVARREIGA